MTDHAEEQEMEAEALSAIFDTHFAIIDGDGWRIDIYPETASEQQELDELNHVACQLQVSLPETYPEVLPELQISILKGLTQDEHVPQMLQLALEEAEANLGVPSIFAIAERIREWLVENNVKGLDDQSMHAQMLRKQTQAEKQAQAQKEKDAMFEAQREETEMTEAELEELQVRKQRAEGTPCNKENFEAWQANFLQEMKEAKQLAQEQAEEGKAGSKKTKGSEKVVDKSGRLTGHQQFADKLDDLEALEAAAENAEEDEDEPLEDGENNDEDFNEELFEDDVDLDDLDFDDDDDEEEEEDLDI